MLQPMERPPASLAPRLAASMMPGPPPVMTVKPSSADPRADLAGQQVIRMCFLEAGRAEDRDAGTDEVQRPEAADELGGDPPDPDQLDDPRPGAFQELQDPAAAGALRPRGFGRVGRGDQRIFRGIVGLSGPRHADLKRRVTSNSAEDTLLSG